MVEEEIERIVTEFENNNQSPENAGKLFVSMPGARLDPWGGKPSDMDYQGGWEQLVGFVLGAGFGITRPAAGMIEDSSYSTLFATLKQLYWLTLDPKCARIAAKLTRHLAPFFGDNLVVEIRCRRIDDHQIRNERLGVLMQGLAITKNELRMEMEMHVTQEVWGNDIATMPPPPPPPMVDPATGQMIDPMTGQPLPMPQGQGPTNEQLQAAAQNGQDPQLPPEDPEMTNSRPGPGSLGVGALGPRKSLNGVNGYKRKSRK